MGTKSFNNYADLITFSRASGGTALRPVSYGPELVTNGTFDTDSGYNKSSGTTISNGKATISVTSGGYQYLQQFRTYTAGKIYEVTATITGASATGGFRIVDHGSNLGGLTAGNTTTDLTGEAQNIRFVWVANSQSNVIQIDRSGLGDFSFTVDNLSVKEVLFDQPDGTLTLFNHPDNIPRIEYDADGNRLGLLIEEQRTNYISESNSFSSDLGDTVTPNYALSPDGTQNAWLFTSEGDAAARVRNSASAVNAGGDNTVSWFVKNVDANYVQIVNGGSGNLYCNFDLTNGTVGTQGLGSTGGIEDYGNGWYRIFTTWDGATYGVNTNNYLYIQNSADANYAVAEATGLNVSVLIYGCQWEQASFPTSYIPTSGSTATRAADVASIPVADFGYNQKQGTVVVEATALQVGDPSASQAIAEIGTSNRSDIYLLSRNAATSQSRFLVNDGLSQADLTSADFVGGVTSKMAATYKQDDFAMSMDGGTVQTDASGNLPQNVSVMGIGVLANLISNQLNGHIKSIKYYPRRLSNDQLQELTQ